MSHNNPIRVLLVGPNASEQMGGEAILPLHWLRELRARGVDAELLTHDRCRDEIAASRYADMPIHFIEDSTVEKTLFKFFDKKPTALRDLGFQITSFVTNIRLGKKTRQLQKDKRYDLIHQVIPVAPKALLFSRIPGVPFVAGPMNGNMFYPEGFEESHGAGTGRLKRMLTPLTGFAHALFPSKKKSDRLIVSNERTAAGLPHDIPQDRVVEIVENGVDLNQWTMPAVTTPDVPTFVFVGRLVHWKAVDLLLKAFDNLSGPAQLKIIGQGPDRQQLEALAASLPSADRIHFLGQMPQTEVREHMASSTALVLPSVWECGGAVVLEAMACAKPVIATAWGGPCDYVEEDTGILVPPGGSPAALITGLAGAMNKIAADAILARKMGEAGRQRIESHFSWQAKTDQMLDLYKEVLGQHAA